MGVVFVLFIFSVIGASPTHKPSKETPSLFYIWFAGTFLTRSILDHTAFDGPMPKPPSGSLTESEKQKNPELGKEWDRYTQQQNLRVPLYTISWIASPLLFGCVFMLLAPIYRKRFPRKTSR